MNATSPCLDAFCRLDRLGLIVLSQQIEPERAILVCAPTTSASRCPGCSQPGARHDTVVRALVHVPLGWKPTILQVPDPALPMPRVSLDLAALHQAAAPSRGKLSRDAITWAVKSIVIDRLSIARAAANLGVRWNTASDALLAAAGDLVIDSVLVLSEKSGWQRS